MVPHLITDTTGFESSIVFSFLLVLHLMGKVGEKQKKISPFNL